MASTWWLHAAVILALCVCGHNAAKVMRGPIIPDVDDYWPEVAQDLSLVTWSHATNTQKLLRKALDDRNIMMIEADIVMGHLSDQSITDPPIPIMAHPPYITSDLSLEMFVDTIITATAHDGVKKGAKFDMKSIKIVLPSLEILKKRTQQLVFPVWFNADILPGPVDALTTPVDADKFCSLCTEFFPQATLSIGWTTRYTTTDDPAALYTSADIDAMLSVVRDNHLTPRPPLTFPVWAAFVNTSLDTLQGLVDSVPHSTLTVWSSAADIVNITSLVWLQENLGADRVYFDLPPDQRAEFEALRPSTSGAAAATAAIWPHRIALWAGLTAAALVVLVIGVYI